MAHWLVKSEPESYSIDDLAADGVAGVDDPGQRLQPERSSTVFCGGSGQLVKNRIGHGVIVTVQRLAGKWAGPCRHVPLSRTTRPPGARWLSRRLRP